MINEGILILSVILSGLLAGNELATLIAVHPALRSLPLRSQVEAEGVLTRRLGIIMPFYMTAALIGAIAAAISLAGATGFGFAVAGAGALAVMLAITVALNVPLNTRTVEFPPDGEERSWSEIRRRWELLHSVRVVLDVAAFACLVAALSTY